MSTTIMNFSRIRKQQSVLEENFPLISSTNGKMGLDAERKIKKKYELYCKVTE